MSFKLTILGCGSAIPIAERSHSAQYLKINNTRILIDCGENTQFQLQLYKKKIVKLDYIFISHLHGDHFFGLPGLLSTMSMMGRTEPLHIFGPKGLRELIILTQTISKSPLQFQIIFEELRDINEKVLLHQTHDFEVHGFPLNHRIECTGFQFKEKPKLYKIDKDKLPKDITVEQIQTLKKGRDVIEDGKVLHRFKDITIPPAEPSSYAYCSDTAPFKGLSDFVEGSTCLYHESSFTDFHAERAKQTFHSTAKQAGETALNGQVKRMVIGHFSARYKNLDEMIQEAKSVFPNTTLAHEGLEISF